MAARNTAIIRLPLPDPLKKFKLRELRWLWRYLDGRRMIDEADRDASLDLSVRVNKMSDAINSDKNPDEFVKEILSRLNDDLIPEEQLQWIDKENQRVLIWILNNLHRPIPEELLISDQLDNSRPRRLSLADIFAENRHEEIIIEIDTWKIPLEEKMNYLLEKKNEWTHRKTPDKQIKWISAEDDVQLFWALEYLEKNRKVLRVPKPANTKEYHAAVLASLDDLSYGHPSDKKLFMEQMKRTWSQKKFRDSGKAKKPYYLPLTIKTREKLEWLAENSGQKPADILEKLIQENYSKAKQGK